MFRFSSGFGSSFRFATHSRALGLSAALTISAALTLRNTVHLDSQGVFVDPESSISFPQKLTIPSKKRIPELVLLGAGTRRVSILGIKVYSLGLYADLGHPELVVALGENSNLTPTEKLEKIVQTTTCVIRIVPTRNTSYSHLRDAFMRALQMRITLAKKVDPSSISAAEEQDIQSALRTLKSIFPTTTLNKHAILDILITPADSPDSPRTLIFRDLGVVQNKWVATELLLSYLDTPSPSPPMKKAVLARMESLSSLKNV